MTEDATLDEFASAGSDAGESSGDAASARDAGGECGDEHAGGPTDDAVEPAVPTSRFAPDGRACADCGDAVARLWRDGDALVCRDCKAWSG